jgi:hypothetical protein
MFHLHSPSAGWRGNTASHPVLRAPAEGDPIEGTAAQLGSHGPARNAGYENFSV